MEILEFKLAGNSFGIPVEIVREIIPYQVPTEVPVSNACVEGVFMPREVVITAIDLAVYLHRPASLKEGLFIITNYRNLDVAFHVEAATGILKIEQSDIASLDNTLGVDEMHIAKGIIRHDGRLTILLDFDKIITELQPELASEEDKQNYLAGLEK